MSLFPLPSPPKLASNFLGNFRWCGGGDSPMHVSAKDGPHSCILGALNIEITWLSSVSHDRHLDHMTAYLVLRAHEMPSRASTPWLRGMHRGGLSYLEDSFLAGFPEKMPSFLPHFFVKIGWRWPYPITESRGVPPSHVSYKDTYRCPELSRWFDVLSFFLQINCINDIQDTWCSGQIWR